MFKRYLDTNTVNIRIRHGGHLPFLDLCNLSMREHNETFHVSLSAQTVDGGTASIPRSRSQDGDGLLVLATRQEVLEKIAKELQGNILECKGWTMKQLKDPEIGQLDRRCHLYQQTETTQSDGMSKSLTDTKKWEYL